MGALLGWLPQHGSSVEWSSQFFPRCCWRIPTSLTVKFPIRQPALTLAVCDVNCRRRWAIVVVCASALWHNRFFFSLWSWKTTFGARSMETGERKMKRNHSSRTSHKIACEIISRFVAYCVLLLTYHVSFPRQLTALRQLDRFIYLSTGLSVLFYAWRFATVITIKKAKV